MNASHIYLSTYDHLRLRELLSETNEDPVRIDLNAELDRAVVVPAHVRVPSHVVTVGTHVTLQDQLTGELTAAVLTVPGMAPRNSGADISVLEPLGTALLGCTLGDVISFRCGDAVKKTRIVEVVQSPVAKAAAALASN